MRRIVLGFAMLAVSGPAWAQAPASADSAGRRDSLAPYALPAIEVSVTRTESDLARLPYAVYAVTRQDLDRGRQRLGLDEALVAVPGVIAVSRQNYAQDIVLSTRGFGSRTQFGVRGLKILLDGIPQTLPDGQGQLTNVVLDDVDRIEVLRGSASSLYGNASGGVISLRTDQERPVAVRPAVRVLAGAYGLTKYRASLDVPVGQAVMSASGERTSTDGFRTHSGAEMWQGRVRVSVPVAGTTFTLLAHVADDPRLEDPGALTMAELNATPSGANPINVTRDVGKDVTQRQVGLSVARPLSRGGQLGLTVFGLTRSLANPIASTYIAVDRIAYGARVSGTVPVTFGSVGGTVTAGMDGQWLRDDRINENVARTAITRDQRELVNELGPFAQVTLSPWRQVTVNAGARYDRVRFEAQDHFLTDGDDTGIRIMAAVSGSGGVTLALKPEFEPYVSVGTSFETPTTTELGNRETGPGGFNPDLNPQHAVNYEAGLRGLLSSRVRYSAAFYRADVRDELIGFDVVGSPGRRFFRNAGSSRHAGAELGVTAVPVNGLTVRAAYTYSRHRFVRYQTATVVMDGRELPGVPAHFLSGVATLSLWKRLWVTVDQAAASSYFADDPNTVRNAKWAATGIRLGGDVNAAGWRISAFAGVANVWNARYAGSVQVNAAGGRYFEPAPPRNFSVGAEIGAR